MVGSADEKTLEAGRRHSENSCPATPVTGSMPQGGAATGGNHLLTTESTAPGSAEREQPGESFESRKLFPWFFLILLVFSLCLLYFLMRPFIHTIILACVFSALSYPFYLRCLDFLGNRKIPAAVLVLLCITVLGTGIITILVVGFIPQAKDSIAAVNHWLGSADLTALLSQHIEPPLAWVQEHFPEFQLSIQDIRDNLTSISTKAGQFVIGSASSIVTNTVVFIAHILLMLLIMFFLFIDGKMMVSRLSYLIPLKTEQTSVVIDSLRRMSRAVLVGGFSVAVLQGVAGGIGFSIVGIPGLFWGAVMVFAALVPVVGTGLVWVPAVLYLFFFMGDWQKALILLLWCGVGVTSIDSFLRPFLMRGGADVPVLFIFLAILGGINVFGMLGLLYGPMILGFVAVMLDLYAEEYQDILESRSTPRDFIGKTKS